MDNPPDSSAKAARPDNDDTARWEAAARVRREHSRWVVIWSAMRGEFQARPLFRAPRGTVVTGDSPEQLTERMNVMEQATRAKATKR
jgi:hypothetical protein